MLEGTFWLQQPKAPKFIRCDVRYNVLEDWTPPEDVPARELLRDWFNFWAVEFDIKTEMMSIRHGGRLLQSSLDPAPDYKGLLWNIDPFIRTKVLHCFIVPPF
ncbi:hypothetical protein B0H17DRAFT_1037665 [Mycena rosella]|uniref:Uncharacterized protein n=1 Tax=Mycena rosella TaxID=1033263 RepID=A0AAD7GU04_MYCRO|nr:hypothetical protein B0H17DRAFT_1037665 [Mycena rosella]